MNNTQKKKIKKSFESLLQYGWMWGYPKHIEDWKGLEDFYAVYLNDGKPFKPDKTNKAKAI